MARRPKTEPPPMAAARPAPQPAVHAAPPTAPGQSGPVPWLLVGGVILGTILVRGRLLEFPLERDEGEYAYAGQLILQGIPPYRLAYNMKLPGTYAAYAGLMAVFGQTTEGIHRGLILVNGATILLVFLLGRRLFDARAGVVAAATFALLSVGQGAVGMAAHATHFIMIFAVGGAWVLVWACDTGRGWGFFAAGLLFGLAFLMKQHGMLFIAFALLYALRREWQRTSQERGARLSRVALLATGAILPFGLTCLMLAWAGVFERFWFWNFTYARHYIVQASMAQAWRAFWRNVALVIGPNILLWVLAGVGLVAVWWPPPRRGSAFFLTSLLGFSFLAVCPGLYFRNHYFIVLFPAVALLAGAAVTVAGTAGRMPGRLALLVFLAALGGSMLWQKGFLFTDSPADLCQQTYPGNPFVESVKIGQYLAQHAEPGDRLAVLGSEPQLYFYSGLPSATGHVYMYPLMEKHPFSLAMQRDMIAEIEAAEPKFLVIALMRSSWLPRANSETLLPKWGSGYAQKHYIQVGVADMYPRRRATYVWDEQAAGYTPRGQTVMLVYRRKPDAAR